MGEKTASIEELKSRLESLGNLLDILEDSRVPLSDTIRKAQRVALETGDRILDAWMKLELHGLKGISKEVLDLSNFSGDEQKAIVSNHMRSRRVPPELNSLPGVEEEGEGKHGPHWLAHSIDELESLLAVPPSDEDLLLYFLATRSVYSQIRGNLHNYLLDQYQVYLRQLAKVSQKPPIGFKP